MGGFEDKPLRKCEHVYTPLRGRVAVQTLPTRRVSWFPETYEPASWPGNCYSSFGVLLKAIASLAIAGVSLRPSQRTSKKRRRHVAQEQEVRPH